MKKRKESGERIDNKDVKKHRNDIIRLAAILADEGIENLPPKIKSDLSDVLTGFTNEPPDVAAIGKDIGIKDLNLDDIIKQLEKTFHL